jgi:hypothetical protein
MSVDKPHDAGGGHLSEDLANALCKRLSSTHPDRETHQWLPRKVGDGWQVVKVALAPPADNLTAETRADERPAQGDDPRSSHDRNVGGPWGGGGLGA